jgi:Rrf2 family transcriptional regulator, iron-sulfur cluster assembly transcription factor
MALATGAILKMNRAAPVKLLRTNSFVIVSPLRCQPVNFTSRCAICFWESFAGFAIVASLLILAEFSPLFAIIPTVADVDFPSAAPYIGERRQTDSDLLMQVTRAGEYAIIGLCYLAKQSADRIVMIDEISETEGVPKSFLAKIFQSLAKSGIVRSNRGAGGGFSLAKPASEITLLKVLQCVEGVFALQRCVSDDPECVVSTTRMNTCTLCAVFSEAQNRVNEVFARTTLADLLNPKSPVAHNLKTPAPVS